MFRMLKGKSVDTTIYLARNLNFGALVISIFLSLCLLSFALFIAHTISLFGFISRPFYLSLPETLQQLSVVFFANTSLSWPLPEDTPDNTILSLFLFDL